MTALLLFLVIAQCNTASAQISQMRFWSPVRSDQFGGNARLKEGMWGEVTYNYWLITKGKSNTVGWVSPTGTQNVYFSGASFGYRINNMSSGSLGSDFHGGTTLSIGNINKHHGWQLKTTIMQSQVDSHKGTNGSMDIRDDAQIYATPMHAHDAWYYDEQNSGPNQKFVNNTMTNPTGNIPVHFLWGWFLVGDGTGNIPVTGSLDYGYAIAPLPLTFEHYKLDSKVSHWDVEANYIFRTHATRIGFFEFTGGMRYMQFDDSLGFTGWGLPWRGNVLIELIDPTPSYGGGTGGGTTGANAADVTEYYLQQGVLPDTNRNYTYTGTIQGPGTVLADSKWNFKAENHMAGPQVGIRYIKKCSGRWSITADTKFFAAFNTQNIKSEGIFGSRVAGYDPEVLSLVGNNTGDDTILRGSGKMPWVPIGIMQTGQEFHHTRTDHKFSPVIDFGLKANWQFTDAIGFNVGYQGMWLDQTARASMVNDYRIDNNSNIFGLNDKVTQTTWMHGVSAGISINR